MLLSEIGDKEIIDLSKGTRHGKFWDAEMIFEEADGTIKSLLVPRYQIKGKRSHYQDDITLPWSSIVKIGDDIIIIKT